MIERSVDYECKMSVKSDSDDLSNNLNNEKDSFSEFKKKDSGILSDLLKSFRKDDNDKNDSGNDSDSDDDGSETNYASLIAAMSTCDIVNKKSTDKIQYNNTKNQTVVKNDKEKVDTAKNCTANIKMSNAAKKDTDAPNVKKSDTIKLHISIKRNVQRSKSRKNGESDDQNVKNDVNKLSDKLSSVNISSKNNADLHKDDSGCQKSKANRKSDSSNKKCADSNDNDKVKTKDKVILVERGPMRSNSVDTKTKTLPYEGKQVHRNSLSGGKVLTKEPLNLIEDMIPVTVNNNLKIDLSSFASTLYNFKKNESETQYAKTPEKVDELAMVLEVIEEDSTSCTNPNDKDINDSAVQHIEQYLCSPTNVQDDELLKSLVENILEYNELHSEENHNIYSSTPLQINLIPNQDPGYLMTNTPDSGTFGSNSNLSPYSYSPTQGSQSPSYDQCSIENAHLYESPNNSTPSVSGESYSSISSSESPNFQAYDDIFTYCDNSVQKNLYADVGLVQDNSLSPLSNISSENFYGDVVNCHPVESDNFGDIDAYVPSLEKYQQCQTNQTFDDGKSQVHSSIFNSLKSMKKKLAPLASKALPCCVDYKNKSAKQMLEEMFNRLDISMKNKMYCEVHAVSEDKLMELFDGLLSSWNSMGSQFQRLPLLYTTCERLLMRTTTMVKLFEVYRNGHTVLDRAVLTCSQSPLVARYLAECMMRAIPHLPQKREYSIEKSDSSGSTVLHRAANRGTQCATAMAGLLSINDLSKLTIFNVNRLNAEGNSPLHVACSQHIPETPGSPCPCQVNVHVLLKHGGADPNTKDGRSGNTALHIAVDASTCAPNLIMLLLQHGAKPSTKNYGGSTPLDLAKAASRSAPNLQHPKQVIDILKKFK
ncbi:uncharacterized protein LOC143909987 [Arctopsyche grandis]|uniref:uncharacterized protein LOC143909987 n=1 Tax=Arctopsyche grandis TaxID=121162 RepID=UPI00406D71C4